MSAPAAPAEQSPLQAVNGFLHRITVPEYHDLLTIGVLREGEPVELLDGYMIHKWDVVSAAPPSLASITGFRRLTVEDYHKMLAAGMLRDGEPVELLEGYLVRKTSHNTPHGIAVQKLTKRLVRVAPPGWEPRCQLPITLPTSEPEPDGLLARGDESTFATHHPFPSEIGLVIEVSDTSLGFDRGEKGRIYARAAIPVYWIVNVADRQVEVYSNPDPVADPPRYRDRTDYRPGDQIPITLDGTTPATIAVSDLLP